MDLRRSLLSPAVEMAYLELDIFDGYYAPPDIQAAL